MTSIIRLLPDHVANQIAAGEVVQRPASVVKELLENAVDAKATEITLVVKDAGKTLVQVIDNGVGMGDEDARLCFSRHATSKIRQAEDLFALGTKGFRGEALASIAAIAHVELKTRLHDQELGTHLVIEGSKFVTQDPAAIAKGTSFAVKNLFYNIPARRNFLKSDVVEMRHIIDEFQRVALAHPSIRFTMYQGNQEVFGLPGSNLRQRIVNIFSGKTNEKLVPVGEETEIVRLTGFATKPEFARKSRGEQFFFVNNRFIRSGYLHHAVMSAYEGLLKDGCQPAYFLYLEVPPESIDINIHPTKTEIKFDDEHSLYAILRSAIKHALGQFNVAPILDFDRDSNLDTPYSYRNQEASVPTIELNGAFNPFDDRPKGATASFPRRETASWQTLYVGLKESAAIAMPEVETADEVAPSLFEETDEVQANRTYQLHKKYIVTPIKSGMVIVDQQRAHQRVLYEDFLSGMTLKQSASQRLLFPLTLFFPRAQVAMLLEMKSTLVATGFDYDEADGAIVVSGVPVNVSESEVSIVLEELLGDLQDGIPGSAYSQNDSIARSMARSVAVKTGVHLTPREQENLVNSLFACREPELSPFGKPTFITMRVEDIDKKFTV